jgi:hypothetical protein
MDADEGFTMVKRSERGVVSWLATNNLLKARGIGSVMTYFHGKLSKASTNRAARVWASEKPGSDVSGTASGGLESPAEVTSCLVSS